MVAPGVSAYTEIAWRLLQEEMNQRGIQPSFSASPSSRRKRRWFFKVLSVEDAHAAMKISSWTFFLLAGLQGVMFILFEIFEETGTIASLPAQMLTITLPIVALALLIQLRQSRTAAICLLPYGLLGFSAFPRGIIVAALFIYAVYKGIQGTFKYHKLMGTRVVWKNVALLVGVIGLYDILGVVLSLAISASFDLFENVEELSSQEFLIGAIFSLPLVVLTFMGAFRVLPGTRRFAVVTS